MRIEELCLILDGLRDRDFLINVELRAALDAEVAELERVDRALKQLDCVCASVHQVNFGYHSDCAITVWVNLSG